LAFSLLSLEKCFHLCQPMIEKKLYDTTKPQEKAILVAVAPKQQAERLTQDYLDELDFLSTTAKAEVVKRFVQKLERPDHSTYVGKGKLEEIVAWIEENPIDLVIFDDDLSPAQVRNLEAELKVKILDRSLLILYIFSMRAQTAQAKTQVELAQYQYMLPRLTRLWSHLSKQRGGIGNRGPGEKELETDRRIVNDRISFLKEKLKEIDKQSVTRRKNREKIVRVALVGYTNVGKSTLMNLLSKSDVFAENKLFATVDATVRKIVWGNIPFLLTDTVGFIRKLPTHLIESFKSTLDEIREADVIVHVVDVAHPAHENQIEVVNQILADLKCAEKPTILVFNKIDMVPASENHLEEKSSHNSVFISAEKKLNINRLREELLVEISKAHMQIFPNWLASEVYSGI
jgi:GTP-binding protein HflX